MKNKYSLFVILILSVVLLAMRVNYTSSSKEKPFLVTTWDAFGYYIYLPSVFIYNDAKDLKWLDTVEQQYHLIGDRLYQAGKCDNGNYAFNYFAGVAIMQSPFFFLGNIVSKLSGEKQDGFSPPYQYAIAYSALFYCLFALFIMRRVLLFYFSDVVTSITLLLIICP